MDNNGKKLILKSVVLNLWVPGVMHKSRRTLKKLPNLFILSVDLMNSEMKIKEEAEYIYRRKTQNNQIRSSYD